MAVTNEDKQRLSQSQIAGVQAATDAWNKAYAAGDKAGMNKASADAKAIRESGGYTSDSYGRYTGEVKSPSASSNYKPSSYTPSSSPPSSSTPSYTTISDVDLMNTISQMQNNAQEWWKTNDAKIRDQLANTNFQLGANAGAYKDPKTGVWYYNGTNNKLFETKYVAPTSTANTQQGTLELPKILDLSELINQQYEAMQREALEKSLFATEQGKRQLQLSLQQALPGYQQARDQSVLTTQQNLDNAALRSAMTGDRGGIGQRQYGVLQNAGDQRLSEINMAQKQIEADTARQIAELEAQGRFSEANIILQTSQQKVAALMQETIRVQNAQQNQYQFETDQAFQHKQFDRGNYEFDTNLAFQQKQYDQNQLLAAQELAYNKALSNLQMGVYSPQDAAALGISASQAKSIADRINRAQGIELQTAQKELALLGASRSTASRSSSGSSSNNNKLYYNQMAQMIKNSGDPAGTFNELNATQKLSKSDYQSLQGLVEEQQARLAETTESKTLSWDRPADGKLDKNITNLNGNGWVYIAGLGRVGMPGELSKHIAEGKVVEKEGANGTVTFAKKE